jgi:hypothetical protein
LRQAAVGGDLAGAGDHSGLSIQSVHVMHPSQKTTNSILERLIHEDN